MDFNPNLDDPKTQMLIAMGLGLIGGAPKSNRNFGADFANAGLLGMNAYAGAKQAQRQDERAKLQDSLLQTQVDQAKRAETQQGLLDAAAKKNFNPGAPSSMLLTDYELPSGPAIPPSMNYGGYLNDVSQIDPMKALAMKAQLASLTQKNLQKVGPGETLYDVGANKPVFSAPDKLPPGMVQGPNGPQYLPAYLQGQQSIRAAGRPQVSVNTQQESAFSKTLGKQYAQDYSGMMKSDADASAKLNQIDRLDQLLSRSGQTGKFTPTTMELKSAAASFGLNVDPKLPYQQAAQAISNQLALTLRNPSGGAGMPGALSDSDRRFLTEMVPNLSKTPEGNKLLLETARKLAQRDKEVAALARQYREKTGKFDDGFFGVLAQYSQAHPLFTPQQPSGGFRVLGVE